MDAHALKALIVATLCAAGAGCSNEQIYHAIQHNQQLECGKLPQAAYEECMREARGSYEDYARERAAVLEGDRREAPVSGG